MSSGVTHARCDVALDQDVITSANRQKPNQYGDFERWRDERDRETEEMVELKWLDDGRVG